MKLRTKFARTTTGSGGQPPLLYERQRTRQPIPPGLAGPDRQGPGVTGLHVHNLVKEYHTDSYRVRVLDRFCFKAGMGEMVVIVGPSGSGKTTLLSCLGGMLSPDSGLIRLNNTEVSNLQPHELNRFRRSSVGFVFQGLNLIPSLTARENVAVPLLVAKSGSRHHCLNQADALLAHVGLTERSHHRPAQLSGGQAQRVAVARGLVNDPILLLADEPTANLDDAQAEVVINLLKGLRSQGRLVVVSSHDSRLVPHADRIVQLSPSDAPIEPEPDRLHRKRPQHRFRPILLPNRVKSDQISPAPNGLSETDLAHPDTSLDAVFERLHATDRTRS